MADFIFGPQAAVDIATGNLVQTDGLTGQVYATLADAQAETTPLTVTLAGGVSGTDVFVSRFGQSVLFISTAGYVVFWRSGDYIVMLLAIETLVDSAEKAVWTINGTAADEDHDVVIEAGGGGVDDAGMATLIETPASATALALEALYGKGFVFLDLDDDPPEGTPDGAVLLRTAGGGTPPPVPVQYMQDLFERTVAAGSIGAPSSGGSYSLIDIPADWSVASGAGIWKAPAAGTRGGFIRSANYSQENVEIVGIVSQESGAVGNRVVTISPRRIVASSTQYGMHLTLRGPTATRPLQVDLGLQKGVTEGDMQSATAGVVTTGALGQKVRFRMQVLQETPTLTRVRGRIWLDGTEEPATWQKDATDSTVAMQGPGSLVIQTRQNSSETVGSEVRIHEYTVQSIV